MHLPARSFDFRFSGMRPKVAMLSDDKRGIVPIAKSHPDRAILSFLALVIPSVSRGILREKAQANFCA